MCVCVEHSRLCLSSSGFLQQMATALTTSDRSIWPSQLISKALNRPKKGEGREKGGGGGGGEGEERGRRGMGVEGGEDMSKLPALRAKRCDF